MRARWLVFAVGVVIGACSGGDPNGDLPLLDDPSAGGNTKKSGGGGVSKGGGNTLPAGDSGTPPPPEGSRRDGGADATSPAPTTTSTTPPPPPPPPTTPFKRIDVRYPIDAGLFLTQCTPDGGKTQLVWKTSATSADPYSRYADPVYTQSPNVQTPCGTPTSSEYPIVLTAFADGVIPNGTFVVKCASKGTAHVYKVTTSVGGSPAATWQYPQADTTCP